MDALMIVALILFLVQVVAWFVLPNSKQISESSVEISSIGDEADKKMAVSR